jgi:hypothetical protein
MLPKRWPSLLAVVLLMATFAVAAWATSGGEPGESDGEATLRTYPKQYADFVRWYQANFKPGKTYQAEVIAVLGRRYKDLDRPARDGIRTIEYHLADLGISVPVPGLNRTSTQWLVLDFDTRTNRLIKKGTREISGPICGFCPHVFALDAVGWRLEGKLLAGCVGASAEGTDTLLLPRATSREGTVRVRLANLAPEIEYLHDALLGAVRLEAGEELDLADDGRPFVWTSERELRDAPAVVRVPGSGAGRVLVLEVRNTSAFEVAIRAHLLDGGPSVAATLTVTFDDGTTQTVRPVGTKFLRRVVVPVPAGAGYASLEMPGSYWLVRRAWTGSGRCAEEEALWRRPSADVDRWQLGPDEAVNLTFPAPEGGRWGYVLRLAGYYEFLRK